MEMFETFRSKHGEHGVQALLENWERFQGIKHTAPLTLERRWEMFISETTHNQASIAA